MNDLITPEFKDSLLTLVLSKELIGNSVTLKPTELPHSDKINFATYCAIFDQFKDVGLLKVFKSASMGNWDYSLHLIATPDALTFQSRGGFYGQEVLFHRLAADLVKEVEKLKPTVPDQAEKIASILGNLASFIQLIN